MRGTSVSRQTIFHPDIVKLIHDLPELSTFEGFVVVVVLRSRQTSKVMSGRSVYLTTLILGRLRLSLVMSLMVSFCDVLFPTRCLG